jgi:hypothetical protein
MRVVQHTALTARARLMLRLPLAGSAIEMCLSLGGLVDGS